MGSRSSTPRALLNWECTDKQEEEELWLSDRKGIGGACARAWQGTVVAAHHLGYEGEFRPALVFSLLSTTVWCCYAHNDQNNSCSSSPQVTQGANGGLAGPV